MSTKLTQDEIYQSVRAARDFKAECIGDYEYTIQADVIVFDYDDEDSELYAISVDVQVDLGPNFHKVYIMWEQEFGEDYKKTTDSELYGTYATNYQKMEYSYKELIIYSDKRKIVIRG